jgi:hypothetical protein
VALGLVPNQFLNCALSTLLCMWWSFAFWVISWGTATTFFPKDHPAFDDCTVTEKSPRSLKSRSRNSKIISSQLLLKFPGVLNEKEWNVWIMKPSCAMGWGFRNVEMSDDDENDRVVTAVDLGWTEVRLLLLTMRFVYSFLPSTDLRDYPPNSRFSGKFRVKPRIWQSNRTFSRLSTLHGLVLCTTWYVLQDGSVVGCTLQ